MNLLNTLINFNFCVDLVTFDSMEKFLIPKNPPTLETCVNGLTNKVATKRSMLDVLGKGKMSINKENEDESKIQNSPEPRRSKRDRKKRTLHNIDNPQDVGESEGAAAKKKRRKSKKKKKKKKRRAANQMSLTSLLDPSTCSKISNSEDSSDDDSDFSDGGGGGGSKGDGDEVVIVDEEEDEMVRLMKAEEFHLKMKEEKKRRNEENAKFFSKSRMTKILGSNGNATNQSSTTHNIDDEPVTLVSGPMHSFFQQKQKKKREEDNEIQMIDCMRVESQYPPSDHQLQNWNLLEFPTAQFTIQQESNNNDVQLRRFRSKERRSPTSTKYSIQTSNFNGRMRDQLFTNLIEKDPSVNENMVDFEEKEEEYDDEIFMEEKFFRVCMRFLRSNESCLRDVSSLSNSLNHPLRAQLTSLIHGMKEWLVDKCKISPIEEEEIEIKIEPHSSIHNMKCENVNGMDEEVDFSEEEEEWDFIEDEDDSNFFMSRDDSYAFNDKVCVVVGSTQSGKTSFVHLICNEIGVNIIEMNSSQVFNYFLIKLLFF